jgi:hypothetical protein
VEQKDFSVTDEELDLLKKRNVDFLKRVKEAQVYKKGFDYSHKISYEERCDDLRVFLIHTFKYFKEFRKKYYETKMDNTYFDKIENELEIPAKEDSSGKEKSEKLSKKEIRIRKFEEFKRENFGVIKNQNLDSINKKNLEKFRKLRKMMEKFKETQLHVQPLIELCEKYRLNKEILKCLYHASHFALNRDYVKATDHYMQIAIGNNPWPIGVTMVGVQERAGRSRIFTHVIKRKQTILFFNNQIISMMTDKRNFLLGINGY